MTTVIMLLMLPIGLYTYFVIEKKNKKEYQKVFDDFQEDISSQEKISSDEKLEQFIQMLVINGYKIKEESSHKVEGEKKVLSMGLMMIGTGFYFIGLIVYLLYFYFMQKPHKVVFVV